MSLEVQTSKPFDAEEYLATIPRQHRESVRSDSYFVDMVEELSKNPEVADLFRETILNGNQERLIEKTRNQITQLKSVYYEQTESLMSSNILGEMRKRSRNREKSIRLQTFKDFIDRMAIIKGGKKDFDGAHQVFRSKDVTDPENAYSGGYDVTVCAHKYTYASFDEISHPQAIGATINGEVSVIAPHGLQGKADLLMMDVADLFTVGYGLGTQPMQILFNNMFDYEGGKEILALYCAVIFKDVNEAQQFLHRNSGRRKAESWYCSPAYVAKHTQEGQEQDLAWFVNAEGKDMRAVTDPNDRLFAIQENMITLFEKIGIVPPLELEIRIPKEARVLPEGTFHNWLEEMRS